MNACNQPLMVMCYTCKEYYEGTPSSILRHVYPDPTYNFVHVQRCGKSDACQGAATLFEYQFDVNPLSEYALRSTKVVHDEAPDWLVEGFVEIFHFRPLASRELTPVEHSMALVFRNRLMNFFSSADLFISYLGGTNE